MRRRAGKDMLSADADREQQRIYPWRAIRWSEQRRKRHEKPTKRLNSCSISLFCRRNPLSLITGRFFLENDGRWLAGKRHVIRDDGLRRVILTVFTVSWSVSIVSDAVFFDLGLMSLFAANKPFTDMFLHRTLEFLICR